MPATPHKAHPFASAWVARHAPLICGGGRVLDVACGSGRHSRLLRDLGHTVVAVDRDAAALAEMADEPGIETHQVDIEAAHWPFDPGTFDALVVTNYLYRPLFAAMVRTLKSGGVLIYETFARGNERYGRPSNPDFLLRSNELLEAFVSLQTVAFEQGIEHRPRTAVVQRICAVSSSEPYDL